MTFRPVVRLAGCVTLTLLLAACVPPPTTTPAPAPAPAPAPSPSAAPASPLTVVIAPPLSDNWVNMPRTEGDWAYRQEAGRSGALFSSPAGEPLMAVGCNATTRQMTLIRFGRDLPQRPLRMEVRTETASQSADVTRASNGSSAGWTLQATDPLLDAIAFSKGHFAVGLTGAYPLYPPSYPEITRVIEDCR
jgi:hypothetical protein